MKKIVTAALLTMPLSLFAEGTASSAEPSKAAAPAATATPAAPAAAVTTAPGAGTVAMTSQVSCVGKTGSALTDEQKKALETAGVKAKTFKNWKSSNVDSADKCKGAYTIENGMANKVMHKTSSKAPVKK